MSDHLEFLRSWASLHPTAQGRENAGEIVTWVEDLVAQITKLEAHKAECHNTMEMMNDLADEMRGSIAELESATSGYVATIETLAREKAEALAKIVALKALVPVVCEACGGSGARAAGAPDYTLRCWTCDGSGLRIPKHLRKRGTGLTWKDSEE